MARRSSSGIIGTWADIQRQRKRQAEAQERAWRAAHEEQQRAQRAATRAHARDQREAQRAYQQSREADAGARTAELDARVARITGVLRAVLAAQPFQLSRLQREAVIPPFAPGPLAVPVIPPDPRAYEVPAPAGLRGISPAARRAHQESARRAGAQYEHDCRAAAAADEQRQRQLADYYRQYEDWAARQRQAVADHNARLLQVSDQMAAGDADALREYFGAALCTSPGWPADFPSRVQLAWDPDAAHLVADWELPGFDVVPAVSRLRYVKADDREIQIARPPGERKGIYRQVLAQCGLAVLAEAFRADHARRVATVTVNGFVQAADPATGRRTKAFVLTVTVGRAALSRVDLARADPVACLEGLLGQLSARPEKPAPVHPARLAAAPSAEPADDSGAGPGSGSLLRMDPLDFEDLVAELFQAMGMEVMTTARSGDGGVDVRAMDPDPIRGGKIVVQVKRYSHTLPPSPVRDLYGTMLHEGATRGILVTTAEPGPGAREFAAGKPLSLIGGRQLAGLLDEYGIGSYTV